MITILLFGFLAFAHAEMFQYPNETACIMVQMTANFVLTDKESTESNEFKLQNAMVQELGSGCGNSTSTLILKLEMDSRLKITFISDGTDVEMKPIFTFSPAAFFPNSSAGTEAVALTTAALGLGSEKDAYICNTKMDISFDPVSNYSLVMTISEVEIQAFNMEDGKFGTAHHCSDDPTGSTTEGPTSEMPPTTMGPTTAPPTTAPPPTPNMYRVKDSEDKVCLEMDAAIMLDVEYETKDGKMNTTMIMVPPTPATNVTGMCGNSTGQLTLEFMEMNATRKVKFDFDVAEDNMAMLTNVTVDIMINFPDAAAPGEVMETKTVNWKLSNRDTFYTCENLNSMLEKNITLDLQSLKVQAFMKDGNFSGEGEDCKATTVAPIITTPMTPSPKPKNPPMNKWGVQENGTLCVYMEGKLEFIIAYMNKDSKSVEQTIVVPFVNDSSMITGDCALTSTSQSLTTMFYDKWELTLVFIKSSKSLQAVEADDFDYELGNVSLSYKLQSDLFPDAKNPDAPMTVNAMMPTGTFKASSGGSYKCNSDETFKLDKNVQFKSSDFAYKAFATGNSTTFDKMTECPKDTETNSIVPIAVGAALAGLVVIVLIAYLVGRRRSRKGYESV